MTVIALDVGGTSIKAALVDPVTFGVHSAEQRPTRAERGPDAVIEEVLVTADRLAGQARQAGRTPRALGLAVAGIVDETRGMATWSANLGWRDVPLAALAEDRLGLPVALGHDVRSGGLAEARLGAGRGVAQLLFVPVGTGIAAAHVVDGRVATGTHGAACELGHVVVRPDGRRCGCGRRGCLEAEASARAVADRYAETTGEVVTAADVVRRARDGEAAASAVWRSTVDALAAGLLTAVTLFDPEMVVLGGGLAEAGDDLLGPLGVALDAARTFEARPALVRAELGDQAGCLGAALLAAALLAGEPPPTTGSPAAEPPAAEPPATGFPVAPRAAVPDDGGTT